MEITLKGTGIDGLYVKAAGRLDLDNAVEYGAKIKDFIEDSVEVITNVTLDFTEITFISSFGLKVILELYKQLKAQEGSLKLKNVSEQLMNSFKMVGFDKFLLFE
ncbi:STAS domain-containing protein [bacterium]|nr:STAS domain-containing protein [bacterium]